MALQINLTGRVALVTGATSGIGLGISKMLARAGCSIAGCGEVTADSDGAQQFINTITTEGAAAFYQQADVTDLAAMQSFVAATANQNDGRIDILISNAGKNIFKGLDCEDADWEQNMALNLTTHWQLAKLCKPYLEKNDGFIIIMASNQAYATIPGCFPYSVTKTALTGLVRSLAIEWGPAIRTVGLAPGFIDTVGNQGWFNSFADPNVERQRTVNMHPVKRLGTADEIGGWCAFLASEYAAFASGTTYLIDGGRSALLQDN